METVDRKVKEDNLLSMLWDSVRNGGVEEEIGEVGLTDVCDVASGVERV